MILASGCSSVARNGGAEPRADGGNSGLGVTVRGGLGAIAGGGLTVEGGLQPLRTALHTVGISLQNSLSWNRAELKDYEHLMPAGLHLLMPAGSSENSHKKDRQD